MKNINEYLKEQALLERRYKNEMPKMLECCNGTLVCEDKSFLNNFVKDPTFEMVDLFIAYGFGELTPIQKYVEHPQGYWDMIYETLIMSHNIDKLINLLKEYFGNTFMYTEIVREKTFYLYLKKDSKSKVLKDFIHNRKYKILNNSLPKELDDLMNFFNYYFSKLEILYGESGCYKILIEPKYSERVTDIVYKKYGGILYHVTEKTNIEKIEKRGLRLKGDGNLYRYIEPRINFFLAHDDTELKERANIIINQKKLSEYSILKIDLNYKEPLNKYVQAAYTLDFYHDNLYKEEWSVYTYGLIHPRLIQEIYLK